MYCLLTRFVFIFVDLIDQMRSVVHPSKTSGNSEVDGIVRNNWMCSCTCSRLRGSVKTSWAAVGPDYESATKLMTIQGQTVSVRLIHLLIAVAVMLLPASQQTIRDACWVMSFWIFGLSPLPARRSSTPCCHASSSYLGFVRGCSTE